MEEMLDEQGLLLKTEELIESKKFTELSEMLKVSNSADIAAMLDELSVENMLIVFRLLSKSSAAEVFVEMDSDKQQILIQAFSDRELKAVIDELYLDDTVDIIDEMPANVVKRIIRQASPDTRKMINELLKYPDDSAGGIMTPEFVDLRQSMTVEQAFDKIRRTGVDKETIYTCYVTDDNKHLLGVVTVLEMLLAEKSAVIGDIMQDNVIYCHTTEDKEEVAAKISKYDFMAIPVVDSEYRLVGIVTFDDAIDVLEEETTEDMEKMAAILPTDKPYLKTGVFQTFFKRIPWLLLLMISATFTGSIITSFEGSINAIAGGIVLTAFIPMLMDTGGNAGSQSSTTVIRSLALDDIKFADFFRVIFKEFRVAILCGVSLAVCSFFKILLVDRMLLGNPNITVMMDITVCLTLVITVILSKLIGASLPLLAKKIGFDPAVMASPFITTIVDAVSLLVYFRIAVWLLI